MTAQRPLGTAWWSFSPSVSGLLQAPRPLMTTEFLQVRILSRYRAHSRRSRHGANSASSPTVVT